MEWAQVASWQFNPPWWAWGLVAALSAGLASLGLWQVRRAEAKEAMLATFLAAQTQPAVELSVTTPPPQPGEIRKVRAHGSYFADRQLLLDNQTLHQRPGYHVWTPLRLVSGQLVTVNRGWLPLRPEPLGSLGAPEGPVAVEGYWRSLPEPGLRVAGGNCGSGPWPRLVQYPDPADMACLYPGEAVVPGLLLLDPQAPGGFAREWNLAATEVPPSRHYGYAVQWFALALTLCALFVKINLKRCP